MAGPSPLPPKEPNEDGWIPLPLKGEEDALSLLKEWWGDSWVTLGSPQMQSFFMVFSQGFLTVATAQLLKNLYLQVRLRSM